MPVVKSKILHKQDVVNFQNSAAIGQKILDGENLYLCKNKHTTVWRLRTINKVAGVGKFGWKTIGRADDIDLRTARKQADEMRKLLRQNINLRTYQDEQKRLGKSFGEITDLFIKSKTKLKPQSITKFYSVMKHVAILNNSIMEKITETDISQLIWKVKNKSPAVATTLLRQIKAIYKFAHEESYLTKKMDIRITAKYETKHRERYLEEDELGLFFSNLFKDESVPLTIKIAIYGLFILMLRRQELLSLEWSDIKGDNRLVVKHTKKIDGFSITLPTQMVNKFQELKKANSKRSKYIFSSRNSYYTGDTLCRYCKELSIKYGLKKPFRPHDARRTALTLLSDRGHSYKVIDTALGHVQLGVNKAYFKTNLSGQRAKLLQEWANLIDELANLK